MVALAPMPRASVIATVKVKPGSRARERSAWRRSWPTPAQPIAPAGAVFARAIDADEPVAGRGQVAEPALGFGPGVGFAHAGGAQLGHGLLEMKGELVVHLGRDVSAALVETEDSAEALDHAVASSTRETARE